MKNIKRIFLFCFVLIFSELYSQEDKLGTKVIDIVKSYTPSIADAYKPREVAPPKDSVTIAKKTINYTIYSVPVASTFVPDKGKASRVHTENKKESLYDSYIALGAGNYTTLYADTYITLPLNKESEVFFDAHHHSSQGNISGVDLDNNFANTQAQLGYKYSDKDYQFSTAANISHRLLHWYGVEDKSFLPIDKSLKQNYINGGLTGYFNMTNSVFSGVDFLLQGLIDDFKSGETHFKVRPNFKFELDENQLVKVNLDVNYLQGKFEKQFQENQSLEYQSMLLGVRPSYQFGIENFSIKAGLGAYYLKLKNIEDSNFKIFPDVEASYDAYGEGLIIYAGLGGDLQQVTYREQSLINPYISPTQQFRPTHTAFNLYGGIKGNFLWGLSYNVKANYGQIKNLPMFKANPKLSTTNYETYQYDNTYSLIYDDAFHLGFLAELGGKVSEKFTFGVAFKADSFSLDKEKEAWNIPVLSSNISASYKVLPNWNIGTKMFFVGNRKDVKHSLSTTSEEQVSLEGFFDMNFYTDYTIANRWTIFANFNNVLGKNYLRWTNYPVQGFQALVGVKYQFNLKLNN
ncbi:MAG: TonB-dependent receptor [Capnocytophaga sp.]|nr:TonB-dependent receptor [Capnocytophaga sp.]